MLTDTQIAEVRLLAVDEMLRHHESLKGVAGMLVRLGDVALRARREILFDAQQHHAKADGATAITAIPFTRLMRSADARKRLRS